MTGTAKRKASGRQFSAFVLVGASAALVNWGARIGLSAAGLPLTVAIIVAYLIGMTMAYALTKAFVFDKSGRAVHEEALRFVLINLISLVQVWAVTVVMQRWGLPAINWNWHPEEVAHAIGVASPVATSYFGHLYFTFDRKGDKADAVKAPETKARK